MVGGRAVPTPLPCRSAPLRNFAQDLFVCPYPSSITGFRPANQHLHAASPSPAELVCKSLRNHPALEEGLNTRLFNKMRRSLSFPTGFLHALSCCQSPRVVSGPGSPWADRFPKSPPCAVSTVSGTANTSCSSWRRRKPRSEQSLASCGWVFFLQNILSVTGDLEDTLCPSVRQENGSNPLYLSPPELAAVFDSCQRLGW